MKLVMNTIWIANFASDLGGNRHHPSVEHSVKSGYFLAWVWLFFLSLLGISLFAIPHIDDDGFFSAIFCFCFVVL